MAAIEKMVAMVNSLKNILLQNQESFGLNLGIKHGGLKVCQVCLNDDRKLTFDFFTERSNLRPHAFVWGKC